VNNAVKYCSHPRYLILVQNPLRNLIAKVRPGNYWTFNKETKKSPVKRARHGTDGVYCSRYYYNVSVNLNITFIPRLSILSLFSYLTSYIIISFSNSNQILNSKYNI